MSEHCSLKPLGVHATERKHGPLFNHVVPTYRARLSAGKGKLILSDGSYYEGSFEQDEVSTAAQTTRYRNCLCRTDPLASNREWLTCYSATQIIGHGVRVYSDGSRHEGQFLHGESSGQGVYTSAQGWSIHGNFVANRAVGHATWQNADGDKYEGAAQLTG